MRNCQLNPKNPHFPSTYSSYSTKWPCLWILSMQEVITTKLVWQIVNKIVMLRDRCEFRVNLMRNSRSKMINGGRIKSQVETPTPSVLFAFLRNLIMKSITNSSCMALKSSRISFRLPLNIISCTVLSEECSLYVKSIFIKLGFQGLFLGKS